MTDSFQGGTFDPIESEDYVAPLTQSYKDINAGMNNYWEQELSNYKYAAEGAGKNLEALAEMSQSISGYLAKREERKKQENISKGMLWLKENPLDIIHQTRFEGEIARLKAEGKEIDEFVANYEKKEGSNIWTSQKFRDLNAAEKYGAVVEWAEGKVQKYDPSNNPELQNATNYEEYKAAEYKASIELYDTLGDLNEALVYKHVIGPQKEKEEAAFSKWNAKREKEIKEERIKIATNQLESCMLNGQIGCHQDYLNTRSPYVGQGNANKEYFTALNGLAQRGKLTSNMITDIELKHRKNRITSKADGKEYWFNDFHSAEWDQVKQSARETESRMMTEKAKATNVAAQKTLDDKLKELQGDNFNAAEGYSPEAMVELRQLHNIFVSTGVTGTPFTRLNNIVNHGSQNQATARLQEVAALKEAETGELTTERLNKKYPLLRDNSVLKNKAKANDPVYGKRTEHLAAIQSEVKSTITIEGGTADEILVIAKFQDEYTALVKQFEDDGVSDPQGQALQIIRGRLQEAKALAEDSIRGNELPIFDGKDWKMFEGVIDFKSDDATFERVGRKIANVKKGLEEQGASFLKTQQLFSPEQLQQWENGQRVPTFATRLADEVNALGHRTEDGQLFTGYDIMQGQKKIANIETLEDPSSVKAYKELSIDAQKLCRENSFNCSIRGLASSGKENTAFIPFEQGESMKLFAEENDSTFPEFAASLELLPKLNLNLGAENPFDSMDDFDWLEYNKAVWKWSGGTNTEALEATKRDAFKTRYNNPNKK